MRFCHLGVESLKQILKPLPRQVFRDEHQLAIAIFSRPAIEPDQRVKHVLNTVHNSRSVGAFHKLDQSLHPEQVGPAMFCLNLQEKSERNRVDWRLEDHCVGGDAVTVSINIMRVVMGMPLRVKPGLHIGWFG